LRPFYFLILSFSLFATADKWPEPLLSSTVSEDSSIIVRVTPGNGFFKLESEIKNAVADVYIWNGSNGYDYSRSVILLNPAAPLDIFVDDDGYIITLDNWYETGYGKAVVIYDQSGDIVKSYELTELFPDSVEFNKLSRSVSSLHWRCRELDAEFNYGYFYVPHMLGGSFRFDYKKGKYDRIMPNERCKNGS